MAGFQKQEPEPAVHHQPLQPRICYRTHMSHRLQVLIPAELNARIDKAAQRGQISKGAWVRKALTSVLDMSGNTSREDSVARLSALNAPTCDIGQMLAEIEAGRG